MKITNMFLLAGLAAALPIVCDAQPAPAQDPAAAARSNIVNSLALELQQAAAQAATNPAAAVTVRRLALQLQVASQFGSDAPAISDPPAAPQVALASTNAAVPAFVPSAVATPVIPAGNPTNSDTPAITTTDNGTNGILMNFANAPLSQVLKYLAESAGFIINAQTTIAGTINVTSKGPVTRDEAVELLTSSLQQNHYSVVRNGRILNITSSEEARYTSPIVVHTNELIENSAEVVTEIIPVHYANVSQLVANLQTLLPTYANLFANESANSLILVATKSDIKRMVEIIDALDNSLASVSSIRVFPLRYEDAKDLATLITQLFTPQGTGQNGGGGGGFRGGGFFNMFRGGGGGFPGGGGGFPGGGAGGGNSSGNGAQAAHVTAVGDDRSNSLIVSAPPDLLNTIAEMVQKIDQPVEDVTELRVFTLKYADVTELANEITALYPDDTTGSSNPGPFPFFFRGGGRGGANTSNTQDDRARKMGKVVAVPEPRTRQLMVTASRAVMPQIADMIQGLDIKGQQEVVAVYDLVNADAWDVQEALSDLFNRNNVHMNSSANSSKTLMGANNPLQSRAVQPQQNINSSTTFGTPGSGGGSGLGR